MLRGHSEICTKLYQTIQSIKKMKFGLEEIFRILIFLTCLGIVSWQCWRCGTKYLSKPQGLHFILHWTFRSNYRKLVYCSQWFEIWNKCFMKDSILGQGNTVRNNWVSTRPCLCSKFSVFQTPWEMLKMLPQLNPLDPSLPYLRDFKWGT